MALVQQYLIEGARAIIVEGNAGMGKSRLLLEVSELKTLKFEERTCQLQPHYEEISRNDSVDSLILRMVDHAYLTSGKPLADKIHRLKSGGLGRFLAHGAVTFGGGPVGGELGVGVLTDFIGALMSGPQSSPRRAFLDLLGKIQVSPDFRVVFVIDSTSDAFTETYAVWQDFAKQLPRYVTFIFAARPDDLLLTRAFGSLPTFKVIKLGGLSENAVDEACDTAIGLSDLDRELLKTKFRSFRGYPLHVFTSLDYLRWEKVPVARLPDTMDELLDDIWSAAVQHDEKVQDLLLGYAVWRRPIGE